MKLLYCPACHDVFQLRLHESRACACGRVTGHYTDGVSAVTNGQGISVAIGNGSLGEAICNLRSMERNRAFYPVMCWVRPNDGPANPHTMVESAPGHPRLPLGPGDDNAAELETAYRNDGGNDG